MIRKDPIIVPFTLKESKANTDYLCIPEDYSEYIFRILNFFLADQAEKMVHNAEIRKVMLKKQPKLLLPGRSGSNSLLSYVAGLCLNHLRNPDINISAKNMDSLEFVFRLCAELYHDNADIRPIRFRESAFEIADIRQQY